MIEALAAFVAALAWAVWSAATTPEASAALVILATFGCAALALLPIALACRRARPIAPPLRSGLMGVALAALPLSVFGAMLFAKTHHRALGAVTFAIVAVVVVALCALLARRVDRMPRRQKSLRVAFTVIAVASLLGTVAWLLGSLGGAPPAERVALRDGLVGAGLAALASFAPLDRVPEGAKRLAFLGFVVAPCGLVLFALNQELRRHLAESAPVATFVMRLFLL